jgi:hypothetical protein
MLKPRFGLNFVPGSHFEESRPFLSRQHHVRVEVPTHETACISWAAFEGAAL